MFDYKSIGDKTYLHYSPRDGEIVDKATLEVLLNNDIPGFVKLSYNTNEDKAELIFDVSSKLALKTFLQANSTDIDVMKILQKISSSLAVIDKYLVDINQVVTSLDYIFIDTKSREVYLLLLPIERNNVGEIKQLFKNIAQAVSVDSYDPNGVYSKMLAVLNTYDVFSPSQFNKFITGLLSSGSGLLSSGSGQLSSGSGLSQAPQGQDQATQPQPQGQAQDQAPQAQAVDSNASPVSGVSIGANVEFGAPSAPSFEAPAPIPAPEVKPAFEVPGGFEIPGGGAFPEPAKKPGKKEKPAKAEKPAKKEKPAKPAKGVKPAKAEKPAKPAKGEKPAPIDTLIDGEKPMSFLTLIAHWSKENKAKYDEQQAILKARKEAAAAATALASNTASPAFETPGSVQAPKTAPVAPAFDTPDSSPASSSPSSPATNSPSSSTQGAPFDVPAPSEPSTSAPNVSQGVFGGTQILAGPNPNDQIDSNTSLLASAIAEVTDDDSDGAVATTTMPKLVRIRNGEVVNVSKSSFMLGRSAEVVDYAITDNSNISGVHALIEHNLASNIWYLSDTNSRNHVFLDDVQITPSTKQELKGGQSIKLADEEFRFEL
jgi:hypothetical protein